METMISEKTIARINAVVSGLIDQESRVVITNDDILERATDLAKIIKTQLKKADEERKTYTAPLNVVIKKINAQFKTMTQDLIGAETSLSKKITAYIREKNKREQEEREILAKKVEERALEEAEFLEKNKQVDLADQSIAEGLNVSTIIKQTKPKSIRGDYGALAISRRSWTFKIDDITKVPKEYLLVNEPLIREFIREYMHSIKQTAKEKNLKGADLDAYVEKEMNELRISGITIYRDVKAVIR